MTIQGGGGKQDCRAAVQKVAEAALRILSCGHATVQPPHPSSPSHAALNLRLLHVHLHYRQQQSKFPPADLCCSWALYLKLYGLVNRSGFKF